MRMPATLQRSRRRWLAGYLVIVAFLVMALLLYTRSVKHDLELHDQRSCEQRLVLASNQRDVLRRLIELTPLNAAERDLFQMDINELNRAIAKGC